ncbi:hypothetical protein HPB51_010927 [Rhipicephalus microplus]|uniref:Ig-like domain-containing protein n=1 Tax=Rhipicephalus microplus TaxID=6941 RepID=A0A9J6D4Z6_RHIMP|nr:hypothetical protein HPB51_010927 [Rhipicephalus microplus]
MRGKPFHLALRSVSENSGRHASPLYHSGNMDLKTSKKSPQVPLKTDEKAKPMHNKPKPINPSRTEVQAAYLRCRGFPVTGKPAQRGEQLTLNETLVIPCDLHKDEASEVRWYHDGRAVGPAVDPRLRVAADGALVIDAAAHTDAGAYRCRWGERDSAALIVTPPVQIETNPETHVVDAGSTFKIDCKRGEVCTLCDSPHRQTCSCRSGERILIALLRLAQSVTGTLRRSRFLQLPGMTISAESESATSGGPTSL